MASLPLFERLQIESHAMCNRACWFCPRIFDTGGKYLDPSGAAVRNRMPTEKILDLLDQAQSLGFQGRVGFHHYSEPLLDPRNLELAHEARIRGMHPCLVTNGDVLRDRPDKCRDVCEVYQHIVMGLYDYESDAELAEAKTYWSAQLPVARLEFSPIGRHSAAARSVAVPRATIPMDVQMRAPNLAYPNAPCHRPLVRMLVQHDGEVALCCEDLRGDFQLGNVYTASLQQIWQSDRHVQIVADLIEGKREKYLLCRSCPAAPTGPAQDGSRINVTLRSTI